MKRNLLRIITLTLLCSLLLSVFSISAFATPVEGITPSGVKLDTIEETIDRYMEEHIGVSSPGAAVAIIKNGEIIFSGAYGFADIESNILVNADTVFEYGSISKLFTWTSVMQLVEQGKLDLDANVRTYLPNEFNQKWKTSHDITMRDIMNHSSGYGEYTFDQMLSENSLELDLADAILKTHPSQYYEPGTASVYSNYATALAGYVVECISGQEFYQYQKENIFNRINMNQTAGHPYLEDNISILEYKSQGYTKDAKGNFHNTGWSHISQYPAGSINGTIDDLAKFLIAFMPDNGATSPLFQNSDTLTVMLSPSYEEGVLGTAHGFFEFDSAISPAFGHGGNTISFSSQLIFVPEEQFGLVVLTNTAQELDITYGLHDFLIGTKIAQTDNLEQTLPDAHDLAGNYVSMRRPENTPIEFGSYLSTVNIQAIDDNTIKFQMSILSGEYVQTAPYTFEILDNSHFLLKVAYGKLIFKMENDAPVQIMVGKGMDFSAFPAHRSNSNLILSVVILVISALLFLILPIVSIIVTIKRRKKNVDSNKKINRIQTCLTLCGTAFLINNVILIGFLMINPMVRYSQVFLFVVVNYLLAIISAVLLIFAGINFNKQTSKAQKIWFVIIGIILISFVSLLMNWNMFVLYI